MPEEGRILATRQNVLDALRDMKTPGALDATEGSLLGGKGGLDVDSLDLVEAATAIDDRFAIRLELPNKVVDALTSGKENLGYLVTMIMEHEPTKPASPSAQPA
jgi:acyl carrier protein